MKKKRERGFTLIELIVVVTIIGLLAGIAIVQVQFAQRKAAENILRADLSNMRKAIDDFYADRQRYPTSLQELVDTHYMRNLPKDPITKKSDWVEVAAEADPSGIDAPLPTDTAGASGGPGIVDVKSNAEGQTLDNVAYKDL